MPAKPVISNNSPLVALWKLDLLSLLRDLYAEVWIPREVKKEFLAIKKEKGLIDEIKPLLILLEENGIYLDKSLITYALKEADEI